MECFKCGIGNLPKGVKVEWHKVGAHGSGFTRVFCGCETGQNLMKTELFKNLPFEPSSRIPNQVQDMPKYVDTVTKNRLK